MAAIYDAQGNYVGDDGAPDLDQMKLELVKKNQPLSSQIPGYGRPVPPAQTKPDPLGAAAGNFTELATKFNPLMMAKAMQESVRTLNPAIPVAGAWADVAQNVQTAGAEAMYNALGNKQGVEKMQQNYVPVTTGRFYQEPTTQLGKEFEEGVVKAMDASKMPAMWPVAMNQPHRPMLTPNDVRVMGAEATRVGRQVKDIPTDFANAQSGLQKLDPITGQPTYGAKLQGVAESVGDIMAQREMQGLPPIPGLPASMQPMNPKLYAMRPEGSRLTNAVIPETSKVSPYSAVTRELINEVVSDGTITPLQTLEEIQNKYLRQPNAEGARDAFFNFLKNKAVEMYPDAPSPGEALDAYKARFSNKETSAPHTLQMYNEFLQTPEGAAIAARVDMPTAEEVVARHEAAVNWLNSQFTNYINEKVGTPNEPGIKLASQGLTYAQRGDVMESAHTTDYELQRRREQAGMPALTDTDKALAAANTQLQTLQQQAIDAITAKREQEAIAKQLGYGAIDPNTGTVAEGMNLGRYEPFAQASRVADKATVALNKQRRVIDNLQLGAAYENAIDTAIKAMPAGELLQKIPYEERQFYPALQKTPKTENAYTASIRQLKNLGFDDMARNFYDDVMSGKIPLDKVPKMTVEKYIRSVAEPRVAKERAAQAEQAAYKDAVDKQFKASADAHIPNDKVFGNVGALEITDKFTPEEVTKLVSEDTTALDVCIGEGGVRRDLPNLWHPGTGNRQYVPIYNVATGERNPDAPSPRMRYINAVRDGSQMVSFRDTVTGEPVAIFDFNPSSRPGKYNIDFASGRANGKIKPEYIEGIKSYLNSREDSIHDVGPNLGENASLFDRQRMANSSLANLIDMPISKFASYDLTGLPRFITRTDLRNYIEDLQNREPVEQVPAVLSQRPSESLESYVTGAVASSIANVLDRVKLELEEAGEPNQTATAVAFFDDIQDYFNAYQTAQGPTRALELTTQRLYDLESEYANSRRITANIIAEGINDLMDDMRGYLDYARNRQAAEAARPRPRAIAVQGDPIPDMDTTELLLEYRDRLTPEQVQWLENFDDRWNGQEGSTDAGQQGLVDEFERWRSVNRLAPEQAPDYLRMTHDAALQLDRQMGVDAGDEMRSVFRVITEGSGLDPVRDTDAFITALRSAADVAARGSVETALNELADDMYTTYIRDWEPEVGPAQPVPAQQPFDFARLVDGIVDEVSQNANPGVGNRVDTIAYRVAERTNPRLDPEGYAQALRQVNTANEHVEVGPALRILADRIYPERFAEEPAPRQPREADLANQRNDAIIQLENSLNDPELNPDDLRFLANGLSNPVDQTANSPWIALTERERREYALALRERANYIEFSPVDFAIRLSNEAGADIADLRDTVQALNDGTFDHEVLRGLPDIERDRAAQRTALNLNHILQGMEADARANPPRRGPFRPAGSAAVRGIPLGNLNLRPAITANLLRGPDTQTVGNFLQQVRSLPGVTQEGLATGLMAFENMDPAQRITKAAFVRELLPSSYDIVDLKDTNGENVHYRQQAEDFMLEEPGGAFLEMGIPDRYHEQLQNVIEGYAEFRELSSGAKRALREKNIVDIDDLHAAYDDAYEKAIQTTMEYLADHDGVALANESGYRYDATQRLVKQDANAPSANTQYTEFGVSHPDQVGTYTHFPGADGLIGHVRGSYNATEPLRVTTTTADDFLTKPNSFVIEEIQSDAQKHSAQVGHLHQVHGILFKAAIQKALESGADTVYLPTAKVIASKRPGNGAHVRRLNERGLPVMTYVGTDTTAKFAPIYDKAIVKEGLKPLLKIPGVTSRLVNGYHEIDFTPEAKEHILNGQGQTIPGYQAGGSVKKPEVKTPWLFSVPTYSETVAYEMYPGQKGQDDQRDAARHMLAAGTLSRKYGPGVAEFMGKAHEFTTSPLQAVKTLFGGQMPADYGMDTHNNAVGAQLGQRAKSQAELEDLVQEAAERASRTQTQGQAFIKKANGGIVQQNPTTDQMRYALMMRRK